MKNDHHNFHVPLPTVLYEQLKAESARARQPATRLVREAIQAWLDACQRQRLHDSITAYAANHAGTAADLDLDLESAAVSHLIGTDTET